MKLGHSNDEIVYDITDGTTAIYLLVLDGKMTMRFYCDTADAEKTIVIARHDGTGKQPTAGRFTTVEKLLESPEGEPLGIESRVDEKSVYTYVLPRLHVLLGRLLRAA